MIDDGRTSASTSSTMRCPARCAVWSRRASTAGQVAEYGSCIPSPSARQAIVDAVPIVMQCPGERAIAPSATAHSAGVMVPAASSSSKRHTCVPEPS